MRQVNIYLWSSLKSVKTAETLNEAVGYVLQTNTSKGPAEVWRTVLLSDISEKMTGNQAELYALKLALDRMNTKCELHIYTECDYMANVIKNGWYATWKENNWLAKSGKEVANKEEWQQLAELLEGHAAVMHVKEHHEFTKWLKSEVEDKHECVGDRPNV